MSTLRKAKGIARKAHDGRQDKGGVPYIEHPLAVASKMPTDELKIVAVLHDVVEDEPERFGFNQLKSYGFSEAVIAALESLTRGENENYWDYLRRVADNDLAIEVKLADLAHNSERSRIPAPKPEDIARWEKYRKAAEYLSDVKAFKAHNQNIDLSKEPFKYILHRKLYAALREDYSALCDALMLVLESISKSVCPSAIIQGRAKNLDSFTEKCARKAKKYGKSHFAMMTDLCGTRIILQTTGQVAEFCELLKRYFEIDEENSEDAGSRLGNDQFGYISQHFIVSYMLELTNILGVEIDVQRFKGMKAEIQVRTLAQHINADTLHDRLYKTAVEPLKEHWREGSKIAAMAEILDGNLNAFVEAYDRFSLHQQSYMGVEKIKEELLILEAMNFGETYPFTKFRNSLKMAAYLRNLGRNSEIVDLLEAFVSAEAQGNLKLDLLFQTRLWFEYGLALLGSGQQSHIAHDYIGNALESYEWLETDRSSKWQDAKRFYVSMALIAGTLAHRKDWLDRALRLDFTNPYACAELLPHTELDPSLIHGAISAAEDHLRGGINEPEVHFVLGRLWFALSEDEDARAIGYFLDGLLFYLFRAEKENIRVRQVLEREIQYLSGRKMDKAKKTLAGLAKLAFGRVYEDASAAADKTIWVISHNAVLASSAPGYSIRAFNARDFAGRVKEMTEAPGYLFMESGGELDELLVKAALIIGLKVVSTSKDMNLRLALNDKVRGTKRFYTLPLEAESLTGLFSERKSYLTEAQIDSVAKNAHERYVAQRFKKMRDSGETPGDLGERTAFWAKLDETYKSSNLDQAAFTPVMFAALGYKFTSNRKGAKGWDDLSATEQERLARIEHGRWNAERTMAGWSYYHKRDNKKLLHNLIVAWDELSEEDQYFDTSVINNFAEAGLYLHKIRK